MLHLLCSQLSVCVWKGGIQINVINRSTAREMFRLMGLDVASRCLKDSIEKKGHAFPATMPVITLSVFLTLHKIYQFFEKK